MIINLKNRQDAQHYLEASSAAGRAGIEQLTNYDYPDVRFGTFETCRRSNVRLLQG
jgi:hypothetical protein